MNNDLHFSTGNNTVEVPDDFFAELDREFNFIADMTALRANSKCHDYYGPDHEDYDRRDALAVRWPVGNVWSNPPYGSAEKACRQGCELKRCVKRGYHNQSDLPGCADFVRKAFESRKTTTTVMLLAARTDTAHWHKYIWDNKRHRPHRGVEVRFIAGRLTFKGQDDPAPFPSVVVIFKGK